MQSFGIKTRAAHQGHKHQQPWIQQPWIQQPWIQHGQPMFTLQLFTETAALMAMPQDEDQQ